MNKIIDNIKKLFFNNKKRTLITIIAFVVISFGIGYLAFAEGDEFAGEIVVKEGDVKISEKDGIVDGTAPFDECTECGDGEDNNASNRIVRNFDSIKYTIDYKLRISLNKTNKMKYESTNIVAPNRKVSFVVFIPKGTNATISQASGADTGMTGQDKKVIGNYIYAILPVNNIDAVLYDDETNNSKNKFSFIINDINVQENNYEITPKILIFDEASTKGKEILTSIENGNFNIDEFKMDNRNDDEDSYDEYVFEPETVTVTGAEDYTINLFEGPSSIDDTTKNRTFTTAIVLGMNIDENKGLKGKLIPKEVKLKLDISSDKSYESFTEIEDKLNNYDYICESNINFNSGSKDLPCIGDMTGNPKNNGKFGYDSDNKIVTFKDIGVLEKNDSYFSTMYNDEAINIKVISAKIFKFKATRKDNEEDSIINFTASSTNNEDISKTLSLTDKFGNYVGNFSSTIDLLDRSGNEEGKKQESGKANYNYGDEFYISATMSYSNKTGGQSLHKLYNYIKIDSEAIVPVYSDDIITKLTINGKADETGAAIEYLYGKWNQDYILLNDDAPDTCPSKTAFGKLSKEELMNLYGGPCVKLKDGVQFRGSLRTEDEKKPGDDTELILIRTTVEKIEPQTKINIKIPAIVRNNINLSNETYQIVTNSTAKVNEKDTDIIYLSDKIDSNDTRIMSNPSNYKKSTYDLKNRKLTLHSISNNSIAGNTILVSAVKVDKPSIDSYYNDTDEKSDEFNNFPIRWEITTSARCNGEYTGAEVYVYLPKYLKYLENSAVDENNKPISKEVIQSDKEGYTEYLFKFDSEQIDEEGNINFSIKTDREFTMPDNTEQTLYARSDFYIENKNDSNNPYHALTPNEDREHSKSVLLHNYSEILKTGVADPVKIENNKSYTYNAKVFNNTNSASKLSLLYILPYKGDISGENVGSDYEGSISVKLSQLLDGYDVYYTKKSSNTIFGNEVINGDNEWKVWDNYLEDMTGITAVKIVSKGNVEKNQYFVSENGISFTITTKGNNFGDQYYNNFTIFTLNNNKIEDYSNSSTSIVSVYDRKISGFVFEDSDYNGLYNESFEKNMIDIPVELYKLSVDEVDINSNILDLISTNDKKVDETVTDKNGKYSFKGLGPGYYYTKYTFDCNKYTATDKGKKSDGLSNSESINSNANMLNNSCGAVSDIIELNDKDKLEKKNINLGLAVRKVFGINLKKYITNVTVNSTKGTTSYDYNNENKVKIDVKNLKNTSIRVTYKFEMQNSKYFPGYVGLISENIPAGMTFNPKLPENEGWVEYAGGLYYTKFQNTLIMPGEKYYFAIILDLVTNTAGDYVNIISGSNFSVLGEDGIKIDFDDLNFEVGDQTNTEQNNEQNSDAKSE